VTMARGLVSEVVMEIGYPVRFGLSLVSRT
jgi:hypothetical protein